MRDYLWCMSLLEWLKFWSKIFQNTPYSEVQFQNTPPPMKIVGESKSESFRIPPQNENLSESPNPRISEYPPKWKLSESPNLRVSEYPPPQWKLSEFKSQSFRIPPNENCQSSNPRVSEYPPKIRKTSDFKLQNSLKTREIYVETNL